MKQEAELVQHVLRLVERGEEDFRDDTVFRRRKLKEKEILLRSVGTLSIPVPIIIHEEEMGVKDSVSFHARLLKGVGGKSSRRGKAVPVPRNSFAKKQARRPHYRRRVIWTVMYAVLGSIFIIALTLIALSYVLKIEVTA